jgi:hypothetical protein
MANWKKKVAKKFVKFWKILGQQNLHLKIKIKIELRILVYSTQSNLSGSMELIHRPAQLARYSCVDN